MQDSALLQGVHVLQVNMKTNWNQPKLLSCFSFIMSGRRHWFSKEVETTCPTSALKIKIIKKRVFFGRRSITEMKPHVKITRKQKNMTDISSISTSTESEPTVSLVGTSSLEKLLAKRIRLS
jgi:hypothetical protein